MKDLFYIEQKVFDDAVLYLEEVKNGSAFELDKFDELVKEYGRLLKQLRRVTKMSDRTTGNLITSKIDLLDKVHYDALTGIYNRRFLEDSMMQIIKTNARSGECLSVMMIDIDFFKAYNDTYGHNQGDVCLKSIAETIAGCLSRTSDFTSRYGGEEFAVILPNTVENGARIMANKILEAVRKRNIPHEKSSVANCVTVSIGLTTSNVAHGQRGEDYIKRADAALYKSKMNGRNRYTFIDFKEES